MVINLWDSSTGVTEKPKAPATPRPPGKPRSLAEPIWNIKFTTHTGKVIEDFPLAYVLYHNSPWVLFEILKLYQVIDHRMTAEQAIAIEDGNVPVMKQVTDALKKSIDKELVPKDAQYAKLKDTVENLFLKFNEAVNARQGRTPESDGDKRDILDVIKQHFPSSKLNDNGWQLVRQRVLSNLNASGNFIADRNGKVTKNQERIILSLRDKIISIIIGVERSSVAGPGGI